MHMLLHRATEHRVISIEYHIIEIHSSDCITPSPPPVSVSAYFTVIVMRLLNQVLAMVGTLGQWQEILVAMGGQRCRSKVYK
jgi:hypothetical protein